LADTRIPGPWHKPVESMNVPEQRFAERYATWQALHRLHGPGRSYAYAWRLPELARPLGRMALQRAQHALALDLYTLGRFPEALAALPEHPAQSDDTEIQHLGMRLRVLLDLHQAPTMDATETPSLEGCYLGYLSDLPRPDPRAIPEPPSSPQGPWAALLSAWSRARSGRVVDLADAHHALARLRPAFPCLAAQGEALLAETVYWQGRAWSNVWLDHALDQVEYFSQHHLKARLLGLKARALAATGDLGDSLRFQKLAAALATRQGAHRYRRLFIEEPWEGSP